MRPSHPPLHSLLLSPSSLLVLLSLPPSRCAHLSLRRLPPFAFPRQHFFPDSRPEELLPSFLPIPHSRSFHWRQEDEFNELEVQERAYLRALAVHRATGLPAIAECTSVYVDSSGNKPQSETIYSMADEAMQVGGGVGGVWGSHQISYL